MPAKDYRTRNLLEASTLSLVVSIPDLEKDAGDIFWFVFPPEAEKKSKEYWAGKTTVIAKELSDAVRNLKERMNSFNG